MIRDYVDCLVTIQDKIYINGDVTLYKDFDNVYLKIEVGTVRNKLHKSVFIKTFAYCNFHPKNNAMMKMVVVSLRNTTNFDFNCPVKKGSIFYEIWKSFLQNFHISYSTKRKLHIMYALGHTSNIRGSWSNWRKPTHHLLLKEAVSSVEFFLMKFTNGKFSKLRCF